MKSLAFNRDWLRPHAGQGRLFSQMLWYRRRYLFSVQHRSVPLASAKEPEKSGHSTVDKRRQVIYLG